MDATTLRLANQGTIFSEHKAFEDFYIFDILTKCENNEKIAEIFWLVKYN